MREIITPKDFLRFVISVFHNGLKYTSLCLGSCLGLCLGMGISFNASAEALKVGAEQFDAYVPLLTDKRVALVVNQSALVSYPEPLNSLDATPNSADSHGVSSSSSGTQHLLDALLNRNINVVSIMSPEHGFRGDKDAGEKVDSNTDIQTGLPIHSLYGTTKKPTAAMLENIDTVVFDIQDVGVRFYTYLSTLHYVIEAAFEQGIDVIVLDRPNPNIAYVDGPILTPPFTSFIGMHPIPVLHGMTLGELANMIVGEGWLGTDKRAKLTIVPVANYTRTTSYSLPTAPSPNLPNDSAIRLYPTLCFFEGTSVSIGRGTDLPFQLIGHPIAKLGSSRIEVNANRGASNPKHKDRTLFAKILAPEPNVLDSYDTEFSHLKNTKTEKQISTLKAEKSASPKPSSKELKTDDKYAEKAALKNTKLSSISGLHIQTLLDTFNMVKPTGEPFFTRPHFFDKLAGSSSLRESILAGKNADEIHATWQAGLVNFKAQREPYLLYSEHTLHDSK